MKKTVKQLKGTTPLFEVKKNGRHVGVLNTETYIEDCIFYDVGERPMIGDNLILPEDVRQKLAFRVYNTRDAYFGIIYPNEKKFKKTLWNTELISQELASFTTVSKIMHWGKNTYIQLTRDDNSQIDYLFSTAFNWNE